MNNNIIKKPNLEYKKFFYKQIEKVKKRFIFMNQKLYFELKKKKNFQI